MSAKNGSFSRGNTVALGLTVDLDCNKGRESGKDAVELSKAVR